MELEQMRSLWCKKKKRIIGVAFLALVLLVVVLVLILVQTTKKPKPEMQVVNKATLERIINASDLSTFKSVYNGVAVVKDQKGKKIEYYVAYEATVKAGIDFKDVEITIDEATRNVHISIPPVHITEATVDSGSLEYMFEKDRANTEDVSIEALKMCEQDLKEESAKQTALLTCAAENAKNVLRAWVEPFLERTEEKYTLTVELEGDAK